MTAGALIPVQPAELGNPVRFARPKHLVALLPGILLTVALPDIC